MSSRLWLLAAAAWWGLLFGCQAPRVGSSPASSETVHAAARWELEVPPVLNGPLGHCEGFPRVHCCAGDNGRVGLVWQSGPTGYVGASSMAVLGDAVEASAPFKRYPAEAYPIEISAVAFLEGKWYGVTDFLPPQGGPGTDPTKFGVALLPFYADGWEQPQLVLPGVALGSLGASACGHDDTIDLFWIDLYLPRMAFPDSGLEREQLWYARVRPGQPGSPRKLCDLPGPHSHCLSPTYLRVDSDRYDLVYARSLSVWPGSYSTDLMCLPNVLQPDLTGPRHCAPMKEGSGWSLQAAGLPDHRAVALWLEGATTTEPDKLVQAEFANDRIVCSGDVARGFKWDGLTMARLGSEDPTGVVAVWSGHQRHLTYAIRRGVGQWSTPLETALKIGRFNWLVSTDDGLVLVTENDSNLYWARLRPRIASNGE
jgi:hypothetical protein